jgi:hypothetical protein
LLKKIIQAGRSSKHFSYLNYILIGAGVYTIAPFLFLAKYNQPSADDYTLAIRDSTHPLLTVVNDVYANWSGRYLAPVFSRLNPLLFDPSWYNIYPVILIATFVLALVILLKELLRRKCRFVEVLAISAVLIHLIFSQTPSISEAFYWFSGSCIYQTANIFTMLLITVLSRLTRAVNARSRVVYTALAAILCILIIGCNEVSMVIVCFIVFAICINDFVARKKISISHLIILFVCLTCSAAVFFSPGNLARIDDPVYYNKSLSWTFFGATSVAILYSLKWSVSLLAASLLYLLLYSEKIDAESKVSQVYSIQPPLFYFLAVFLLLQFVMFYIAGGGNLGRVENNVYLLVLIGYFFNLHLFVKKYQPLNVLPFRVKRFLVLFSILFFLFDVFNVENNTTSAYVDILSGRAKKYNEELKERLALAKECKKDTCYVPPLSVLPKSLFVTDIRMKSDSMFLWINKSYAQFYHVPFLLVMGHLPAVEPNVEIIRNLGKEIRKNMVEK